MSVFNVDELLTPHPTPKLEQHNLSAVLDFLFNIFLATLYIGGRFSIRSLTMRLIFVAGTHLSLCLLLHNNTKCSTNLDVFTIFLQPLCIHITLLYREFI